MATDVSVLTRFIDDAYYTTAKGNVYVIGGVTGSGGGTPSLSNYYTKVELQAGALDDLYVEEISGDANLFPYTTGDGNLTADSSFYFTDSSLYLGRDGLILGDGTGTTWIKPLGTSQLYLRAGDGTTVGQQGWFRAGDGPFGGGTMNLIGGNATTSGNGGNAYINAGTGDLAGVVSIAFTGRLTQIWSDTSINGNLIVHNDLTIDLDASIGDDLFVSDQLTTDYQIGKEGFISGWLGTGYRLNYADGDYDLEIDNLRVRKAMNVYELIVDKIRATNGSLWVTDAAAAKWPGEDASAINAGLWWESTGAKQFQWYFWTDSSMNVFREDDLIIAQQFRGNDVNRYEFVVTDIDSEKVYVRDWGTERNDGAGPGGAMSSVNINVDTWNDGGSGGYDFSGTTNQAFRTNYFQVRGAGKVTFSAVWNPVGDQGNISIQVFDWEDKAISTFEYQTLGAVSSFTKDISVIYDLGVSGRSSDPSCYIKVKLLSATTEADDFGFTTILDKTLSTASGENNVDGYDFARLGNISDVTRQGSLYLTASDSDNPYLQVNDGMDTFTTGMDNIKVRLGKLTGINDPYFGGVLDASYGLYTDSGFFKGSLYSTDGSIGGWHIDSSSIFTGTEQLADGYATTGLTLAADGGFHAKNAYINADGDAGFRQVEEAIFKTDDDDQGIKIQNADIWEDACIGGMGGFGGKFLASSWIRINYKAYNGIGSATTPRNLAVYDGSGGQIWACAGASTNLYSGGSQEWYLKNTINHYGSTRITGGIGFNSGRGTATDTLGNGETYYISTPGGSGRVIRLPDKPIPGQIHRIKNASATYTIDVSCANGTYPLYTTTNVSSVTIATGKTREFFFDWGSASDPFPGTKKWQVMDYS